MKNSLTTRHKGEGNEKELMGFKVEDLKDVAQWQNEEDLKGAQKGEAKIKRKATKEAKQMLDMVFDHFLPSSLKAHSYVAHLVTGWPMSVQIGIRLDGACEIVVFFDTIPMLAQADHYDPANWMVRDASEHASFKVWVADHLDDTDFDLAPWGVSRRAIEFHLGHGENFFDALHFALDNFEADETMVMLAIKRNEDLAAAEDVPATTPTPTQDLDKKMEAARLLDLAMAHKLTPAESIALAQVFATLEVADQIESIGINGLHMPGGEL